MGPISGNDRGLGKTFQAAAIMSGAALTWFRCETCRNVNIHLTGACYRGHVSGIG